MTRTLVRGATLLVLLVVATVSTGWTRFERPRERHGLRLLADIADTTPVVVAPAEDVESGASRRSLGQDASADWPDEVAHFDACSGRLPPNRSREELRRGAASHLPRGPPSVA